jgi:hypothetical protein
MSESALYRFFVKENHRLIPRRPINFESRVSLRLFRLLAMQLVLVALTGALPGYAQTSTPDAKSSTHPGDFKPYLCAFVVPRNDPYKIAKDAKSFCPESLGAKVLVPDNGDVVVVVPAADYFAALQAVPVGQTLQLSLNGMPMAGSAVLDGKILSNTEARLNFRVTQVDTKDARDFWSTVFQQIGFHALTPLYLTIGWPGVPDYFRPPNVGGSADALLVTSIWNVAAAALLGVAVLGGFLWALLGSDVYRIGARLDTGKRQAFSFARVQWGLWTTFAVTSAIYLWIVYGTFPGLSGTVLALAGVSTLTATTSFFMDASNPPKPEASQGFWTDMLSGSGDSTAQAHRFQALVVNVVLLVAGCYFVLRHLGYPIFDSTWLGMLGVSDAGQLVGKQLLEGKDADSRASGLPPPTLPPPPSAAANPTAGLPMPTLPIPPAIPHQGP